MRLPVRGARASAAWGLRTHCGTSTLAVALAGAGLAAALPVALLLSGDGAGGMLGSRLQFALAPAVAESGWALARLPSSLQAEAVRLLFLTLVALAAVAFGVAALGVLLLFAARAAERAGEMALRRAVGASRASLLAAALLEGGAVAGLALATAGFAGGYAGRVAAVAWPGALGAGTWWPAVGAALAMALAVLAAAGLTLIFAPRGRLADSASRPAGLAVPTAQLGFALIILTAGALLARHAAVRTGDIAERPLVGQVFTGTAAAGHAGSRSAQYAALLGSLQASAKFDTVSLTSSGAVVGLGTVSVATTDCGLCPFGGLLVPWHPVPATHQFMSADSFQALGVRVVAGRGIKPLDTWNAPRIAVVNRALALRHFQDGQAIGRRILLGNDVRTWHTVVGVVEDPPVAGLGGALLPSFTIYASVLQHPERNVELLVRPRHGVSVGPPAGGALARALGVPPAGVRAVSEAGLLAAQLAPLTWFGTMVEVEGWVALGIAALATLVQMRLWVRAHESELGLRRALGARRGRLMGLVLLRAAGVGAGGIAVGLGFGPAAWSAVGTVVDGLPVCEPGLVLRYAALLVAITTLGALLPAWRVLRVVPARLLGSGA
ncbi:MAG: FtsX-like permease family protein [Gemmatimonadales bacterium]